MELTVYRDPKEGTCWREFYEKSEADKVIADRDCEIKELKGALDQLIKAKTEQIIDEVMQNTLIYGEGFIRVKDAMKLIAEIRHNKYKRCLAMAKLCRSVWAAAIFIHEKGGTDKQAAFYMKWEKRWLSLANKFKDKEA